MLSSLEMVSEPSGKTKTLGDLIKDLSSESAKGSIFVDTLPEVSEAKENTLYILNVFEAAHNITIFDESEDKDKFIGAEKTFSDAWSKYSSAVFTGGNNQNGDVWSDYPDTGVITINNPKAGDEIHFTAGSTDQGKYVLTETGLVRTSDPFNHLGIAKITATVKAVYPTIYILTTYNENLVWFDVINKVILS